MSNPTAVAAPEPGQAQEPASPPEQQAATQPEELTLDLVQQIAKEASKEASEDAFRRAQGLIDKTDNRINKTVREELKRIDSTIAELRDGGVEITPEQEQAMKAKAMQDAYLTDPESPEVGQPPPQAQGDAEPAQAPDPFTAEAWQLMQKEGVVIEDGDPEAATLDRSGGYAFVKSVENAIAAKKERLASAGEEPPTPDRLPTGAGARGSLVTPNYLEMDQAALFEKAFRGK